MKKLILPDGQELIRNSESIITRKDGGHYFYQPGDSKTYDFTIQIDQNGDWDITGHNKITYPSYFDEWTFRKGGDWIDTKNHKDFKTIEEIIMDEINRENEVRKNNECTNLTISPYTLWAVLDCIIIESLILSTIQGNEALGNILIKRFR